MVKYNIWKIRVPIKISKIIDKGDRYYVIAKVGLYMHKIKKINRGVYENVILENKGGFLWIRKLEPLKIEVKDNYRILLLSAIISKIILHEKELSFEQLINNIAKWNKHIGASFSKSEIIEALNLLKNDGIIDISNDKIKLRNGNK